MMKKQFNANAVSVTISPENGWADAGAITVNVSLNPGRMEGMPERSISTVSHTGMNLDRSFPSQAKAGDSSDHLFSTADQSDSTADQSDSTPAKVSTTSLESLDLMALAYCIAQAKDMDVKVVHDLLVTAADYIHRDGADDIWEQVERLTEESDEEHAGGSNSTNSVEDDAGNHAANGTDQDAIIPSANSTDQDACNHAVLNEDEKFTPDKPSAPHHNILTPDDHTGVSVSTSCVDDLEKTEEEAYEEGYQRGLEDGEIGTRIRFNSLSFGRRDLKDAFKAGYNVGFSVGKDYVSHRVRTRRTDAENYYNGYGFVGDDDYDDELFDLD